MGGLDITEETFGKMSARDRDIVMFKNIKDLKTTNKDNPWLVRIIFVWLFILSVFMGLKKYIPVMVLGIFK